MRAFLLLFLPFLAFGQATITCAGSPGNTTGVYKQQCRTATNVTYVCSRSAGCTLAAHWVQSTLTDFTTQVKNRIADQLTYTPSGTGAVPRTQADVNADAGPNIKGYGASTAIADNGPAIQDAIDSLGQNGGTVTAPCGTFPMTTKVIKPRNITLKGCGTYPGTTFQWTPQTGTAFAEADPFALTIPSGGPAQIPGGFENLEIKGPGNQYTANGVLIGGDPASVVVPSTYSGNRTTWKSVVIQGFRDGLYWGTNSYGNTFYDIRVVSNYYGFHTPSTADFGPIPINFISGLFVGNRYSGYTEANGGNYYFHGTQIEYSGPIKNTSGNLFSFFGAHLEKSDITDPDPVTPGSDPEISGAFVEDAGGTAATKVVMYGGGIVLSNAYSGFTGTNPYLFHFTGVQAQVSLFGTFVYAIRPLTTVVDAQVSDTGKSFVVVDIAGDEWTPEIASLASVTAGISVELRKNGRALQFPAINIVTDSSATDDVLTAQRLGITGVVHLTSFWNGGADAWGLYISPLTVPSITGDGTGRIGIGMGNNPPVLTSSGTLHASGDTARVFDATRTPGNLGPGTGDGCYTGETFFDANYLYACLSGNNTSTSTIGRIPWGGATTGAPVIPLAATTGKAACIKSAGPPVVLGYCSTVVAANGDCTCN